MKIDLKCYCTKDMKTNYDKGGILYACSPETKTELLKEDRKRHKDLNIRLSLDRNKHRILPLAVPQFISGWYEISKK